MLLDLHTMQFRGLGERTEQVPTVLVAPYSGLSSTLVDLHPDQSLVRTMMSN